MNSRIRAALTCTGFTAAAVLGLSNPAAAAETAGVWMNGSHSFNIRTSASTSGSLIATISNTSTRVPCTTTPCTRNNEGGSYTCWSGGPSDNDWLKVSINGRTGWVAARCVEVGRI